MILFWETFYQSCIKPRDFVLDLTFKRKWKWRGWWYRMRCVPNSLSTQRGSRPRPVVFHCHPQRGSATGSRVRRQAEASSGNGWRHGSALFPPLLPLTPPTALKDKDPFPQTFAAHPLFLFPAHCTLLTVPYQPHYETLSLEGSEGLIIQNTSFWTIIMTWPWFQGLCIRNTRNSSASNLTELHSVSNYPLTQFTVFLLHPCKKIRINQWQWQLCITYLISTFCSNIKEKYSFQHI